MTKRVLVAGAGSGVGLEAVKLLRGQDRPVTALIRNKQYEAALADLGADVVHSDLGDRDATVAAVASSGANAIVCTIGSKPGDAKRIDFVGVQHLIEGARKAGIDRFVLVTSFGCGETRSAVPEGLLAKIGPALEEKDKAENVLRESGLDYTILRPGGLSSEPATGRAVLTDASDVMGGIARADVAASILDCLASDGARGRVLGVFDRDQVRSGTLTEVSLS